MYSLFQQFYSNKIDNEYNKLAYSENTDFNNQCVNLNNGDNQKCLAAFHAA